MKMRSKLLSAEEFLCRKFPEGGKVLCAVSGGLDSMCLLHWMAGQEKFSVTAAHFNHQLRGKNAQRDEQFVKTYCDARNIPVICGCGDTMALAETGMTVEEAARHLRYAFLENAADGYDAIFTAHHADDNAETMLLNLLRGTGSLGLAGIPQMRGKVCRPFLEVTRAELADYAAENDIPHVEDETNRMDTAARNVLRHKVLPVLKELNPCAVENMSRTASLVRAENDVIESLAAEITAKAECSSTGLSLDAAALQTAEAVSKRAILQMMAQVGGHRKDLTAQHVEAVLALQPNQQISLPYDMIACRADTKLMIRQNNTIQADLPIRLGQTVRFGDWEVTIEPCENGNCSLPEGAELHLTHWRRTDGMADGKGRRSLKRLCAEYGMTPAERDAMPVLRVNGMLAAVPLIGTEISFAKGNFLLPVQVKFDKMKKNRGE